MAAGLNSAAIPFGTATLVLGAGMLWRSRFAASPFYAAGIAALSVACGYMAGHVAERGWPGFPPRDSTHALFWIAAIGAVAGAAHAGRRRLANLLLLLAFGGIAAAIVLQRNAVWPLSWKIAGGGAVAVLFATGATAPMRAAQAGYRNSGLLPLGITMAATAVALIAGRSALLGQLAVATSFAFAPAGLLISTRRFDRPGTEAAIVPCFLLLVIALLLGCSFAMLPIPAAILLAAAPASAYLCTMTHLSPRGRIAAAMGLASVLAGGALAITVLQVPPLRLDEL